MRPPQLVGDDERRAVAAEVEVDGARHIYVRGELGQGLTPTCVGCEDEMTPRELKLSVDDK
jgi:hypothetical protein